MPKMKTKSGAAKRFKCAGQRRHQALAGVHAPHPHQEDAPRASASCAALPTVHASDTASVRAMLPYA